MYSIITLPSNFTASTTQVMGELFGDFGPFLTLLFGVIIVLAVLEALVAIIRK